MPKRKKSKRWLEDNINQLIQSVNVLYNNLNNIGGTLTAYIEMKNDVKKLRKYVEKRSKVLNEEKSDDKSSKEDVQRDS